MFSSWLPLLKHKSSVQRAIVKSRIRHYVPERSLRLWIEKVQPLLTQGDFALPVGLASSHYKGSSKSVIRFFAYGLPAERAHDSLSLENIVLNLLGRYAHSEVTRLRCDAG